MSDLQTRLQEALGDAYQIERELGGGGMSRVFVARERALGRLVVVKVLPPEMAASVNIERFRREIQLAASLQHPHIVPVHAAAQVDDLFYYTMPLVEGESLRAKLAREGGLPIGDAVRILIDVTEGLAYAHAHGVVHRDIKPDNILISGNHAVVTDFGVAKAVSAATGESSLTSIGVALGTPAYMAPEQAAADPLVDHRADLYAVGAMAYEMLAGRPPFSGMSAQQVLAAHMTTAPAPVSSARQSVSPALNALVMRLLEKTPADRVQHATELLATLQSMATPTGGMTPTTATAAMTSGAAAAIRRSHPVRVALLFGLASIAVLATVLVLRNSLGLPDWVLAGAVFVLLLNLPIILGAARMERERIRATSTGTQLPPPSGINRLFTYRRSILTGVVSFGVLAVAVIAYTVMRLTGIGPIGTLQAKGLIKDKQPILLAQFENRSSDTTLAPTLTEALRVDLSQSSSVKLVEPQAVVDALTRMQRPASSVLTPALAREVAEREGIPAVVVGEIDPVGKSYVVSAKVISASTGAVLTAQRETAANDAELIPALDKLSRSLRERIGESLVSIRADAPLERVSTGSLDALRKYTQAMTLEDAGKSEQAEQLLKEATEIDSGFAMGWRKLSVLLGNSSAPYTEVMDASTRAYQHRERLTELERQATIAWYFDVVDPDRDKVLSAYRSMLAIDPDNAIALNNISQALFDRHQYADAESVAVRCMELGHYGTCPFHAMRNQLAQGRREAADSTVARWARGSPHDPSMMRARFALATSRGDYQGGEHFLRVLQSTGPSNAFWQQQNANDAAALAGAQGRLAEAETQYRASASAAEARGAPADFLGEHAFLAEMEMRQRNRPERAVEVLTSALAKHPLASMSPVDRPYVLLASAFAIAGRPEEGERLMSEYSRVMPASLQKGDIERLTALGEIASARGRYAEAISDFEKQREFDGRPNYNVFQIASAFAKLGQADSARAYYERYLSNGGPYRILGDVFYLAATYQRLGEIYEAQGDRRKAIDSYLKLTDLWKNADPELQPIVQDAHARIARLSAEH
ncbi:MAG TPA: protein kinase [Gemmatimonadaceae bacterium]|nr:protein kinase [Gemmatimonadaceae bacterium]